MKIREGSLTALIQLTSEVVSAARLAGEGRPPVQPHEAGGLVAGGLGRARAHQAAQLLRMRVRLRAAEVRRALRRVEESELGLPDHAVRGGVLPVRRGAWQGCDAGKYF